MSLPILFPKLQKIAERESLSFQNFAKILDQVKNPVFLFLAREPKICSISGQYCESLSGKQSLTPFLIIQNWGFII